MKNYNVILFDLDGTLTDPKVGITKSVQHALAKFDIIENNLDNLEKFIGPPLKESFMKFYGFDENDAVKGIEYYREYFSVNGLYENYVYPGIPELLKSLKDNSKTLVVATSKPTVFSEIILKHFELDAYFTAIVGSELDGRRTYKTEVIEYALSLLECKAKEKMVMVGDREHDVIGAKNNGIDCISVTYGYGSIEELQKAKPTFIVGSVEELKNIL